MGATKKCRHCQSEIDKKASACPQCRKKQGMSTAAGCLVLGLLSVVFVPMVCMSLIPDVPPTGGGSGATSPSPEPVETAQGPCREHIAIHGSAFWAEELGRPEMWMQENYRINLWQGASPNKGQKVGELRVGSHALILQESEDDYRVRSPMDSSVGWVSKIQVERTLFQNTETNEECTP